MYSHINSSQNSVVRSATHEDIPHILDFGRKFFVCSKLKENVGFDAPSFVERITDFIENNGPFETGVFVLEIGKPVGVIAGLVYDTWFNSKVRTGQDLFWWIEPEYRNFASANRMLQTLEAWAHDSGALWFTLAATETMRPQSLEKWYRRKGYELSERHFIRNL